MLQRTMLYQLFGKTCIKILCHQKSAGLVIVQNLSLTGQWQVQQGISTVHILQKSMSIKSDPLLYTVSRERERVHLFIHHCSFSLFQVRRIRAATPSFNRTSASLRGATLREHKATITLATVLGVFIICWLPYIVFFTCMGLRHETEPPQLVHSVVLWLGYFNSALNPILYPVLNRDFRRAYGHLLHCRNPRKSISTTITTSGKDRSIISHESQSANECSKSLHLNQEDFKDDASPEHAS